jgi:hypothetical protein
VYTKYHSRGGTTGIQTYGGINLNVYYCIRIGTSLMYDRNGPESKHVSNGVMIGYKNPANLGRPLWPCSTINFLLHFGFMKSLTFHNVMFFINNVCVCVRAHMHVHMYINVMLWGTVLITALFSQLYQKSIKLFYLAQNTKLIC